jgi:hypothetical protein
MRAAKKTRPPIAVPSKARGVEWIPLVLSGHSVEVARSGQEGLERIRTVTNYDLVLCDLAMPGMNVWEVARKKARSRGFGLSLRCAWLPGDHWGTV